MAPSFFLLSSLDFFAFFSFPFRTISKRFCFMNDAVPGLFRSLATVPRTVLLILNIGCKRKRSMKRARACALRRAKMRDTRNLYHRYSEICSNIRRIGGLQLIRIKHQGF